MNSERLILEDAQGQYVLAFKDENKMTRDKIEEVFSEFGYVVSVSGADDQGLCFVRYQSRGDAKYARDSLQDQHSLIKLCDPRVKNQAQKRLERQLSQQSNGSAKSARSSRKESDANDQNGNGCRARDVGALKEKLHLEIGCNELIMPDLVGRNGQPVEESYKFVQNASEVVVGNVPTSLTEAYFLHLFEKWNPIAVSKMEFVHKSGRRYCHVYFMKGQDAEDVERQFDGYEVQGATLLVMRPSALQHEAGC